MIFMADPLKFYLITDLHHYAPSLGTSGKAYEKWNNKEQKCLAETGAIIDAAFSKLIADKDIDIVLIAGDLTSTGAMESHLDLLPKALLLPHTPNREASQITETFFHLNNL
jgi:hypothetical protein